MKAKFAAGYRLVAVSSLYVSSEFCGTDSENKMLTILVACFSCGSSAHCLLHSHSGCKSRTVAWLTSEPVKKMLMVWANVRCRGASVSAHPYKLSTAFIVKCCKTLTMVWLTNDFGTNGICTWISHIINSSLTCCWTDNTHELNWNKKYHLQVIGISDQRIPNWQTAQLYKNWASSWDFGTYHTGDLWRLKQAWASAQSRQSLRCSPTWSMAVEEGWHQNSDI